MRGDKKRETEGWEGQEAGKSNKQSSEHLNLRLNAAAKDRRGKAGEEVAGREEMTREDEKGERTGATEDTNRRQRTQSNS